jgi:predicted FMN-binding regulatory protein PaiB
VFASPSYPAPTPGEIDAFVAEQFCGKLIATDAGGFPRVSLLPFVPGPESIEVHMVQADPTFEALRAAGRASFLVDEPLAFTPHDVVSPDYAGMATLHFRAVVFHVEAEISLAPQHVAEALERLLRRYEEGRRWLPVLDGPTYGRDLRRLAVARLRKVGVEAKFKVAQNRTPDQRERLLEFLRARGQGGDERAARVIQAAAAADPRGRRAPADR